MKYFLLVSSLVFAFGCKKGGLDGKLDELSKIKDKMCDCKDKTCADAAHEEYIAWKKGNSKDDKPSKDQMDRFEQIKVGMNACRAQVSGGDTATPPAGGDPKPAEGETKPADPAAK